MKNIITFNDILLIIIITLIIIGLKLTIPKETCIKENKDILCGKTENISIYLTEIKHKEPYILNGIFITNKTELKNYLGIISKSSD